MKPGEIALTRFLRSRLCAALMLICGVAAGWLTLPPQSNAAVVGQTGIIATAPAIYIDNPLLRSAVNLLLMGLTLFTMGLINRWYQVMRTNSLIYTGLAAIGVGSVPLLSGAPISAWAMAAAVVWGMAVMYSTYDARLVTPRIFLLFAVLSTCSCGQYAFAVYMPVFLIACGQMRCLNLRGLLAAIVGAACPLWLLWGFGLIEPEVLRLPHAQFISPHEMAAAYPLPMIVCAGATLVGGLLLTISNVIRVYSFNARTRAINGVLTVVALATEVMCLVDWMRLGVYMPLLLVTTAMQLTLYFRLNVEQRKGYVAVLTAILFYTGIFIWHLI